MEPDVLIGILAEPDRMRVFAAVIMGADTAAEIVKSTGLPPRVVAEALVRLKDGGLVGTAEGWLLANLNALKEARRRQDQERPREAEPLDPDRTRAAVLRAFVADGRLVAIPSARGKRRVVLEHLAAAFEPGLRYPEREVDAVLRAWHPDYVSLRRYLIDEELLARDHGVYWRIGGPVPPG